MRMIGEVRVSELCMSSSSLMRKIDIEDRGDLGDLDGKRGGPAFALRCRISHEVERYEEIERSRKFSGKESKGIHH